MLSGREEGAVSAPDSAGDLGSADQLWRPNPSFGVSDNQAGPPKRPSHSFLLLFKAVP